MTQSLPDPTKWLTDLMTSRAHGAVARRRRRRDARRRIAAATAPWTKAVADITALQMDALQQLTAPWAAADAGRCADRASRSRTGGSPARRGARTRATRRSPGPTSRRPT